MVRRIVISWVLLVGLVISGVGSGKARADLVGCRNCPQSTTVPHLLFQEVVPMILNYGTEIGLGRTYK